MTRLLIISHTEHYHQGGTVVGWGATVREISHLASLFDEVRHVACLHPGPAPASALPYTAPNVTLVPVRPTGGDGVFSKLGIVGALPGYARTIMRALREADVVHVRCPANISMLAIVLLAFARHPRTRWVKYAGNWCPDGNDPMSYAFQRWWLRRGLARATVTVNGEWPNQPPHVHAFLNPCLTTDEMRKATEIAHTKEMSSPVRLCFVGRVEEAKGVGRAIDALAQVVRHGIDATLDIVGDGPERGAYEERCRELALDERVRFHGWLPRTELAGIYGNAHIIVLPSESEGWPKVLSEAMAYGVVPVTSTAGSIPQYLSGFATGQCAPWADQTAFARALMDYATSPERWQRESQAANAAAAAFTYPAYLEAVKRTVLS